MTVNCAYSPACGIVQYLTTRERVAILRELHRHLTHAYIGWDYKKRRSGIDGDDLFERAIGAEQLTCDACSPLERAQSNLAFFDRLYRLVASFRDAHLIVRPTVAFPFICTGFALRTIGGRLVTTWVDQEASFCHGARIALGDELLQIDGKLVTEKIAELLPFIPASSHETAKSRAVRCLTRRRFHYPHEKASRYTFASRETGKEYESTIEWRTIEEACRRDAEEVLRARGISLPDSKQREINEKLPSSYLDYHPCMSVSDNFENVRTYLHANHSHEATLVTGIWSDRGKRFGVIRIYQMTEELIANDVKINFHKAFADFLAYLKRVRLPLILDIRNNQGGKGELAMFIASFFVPPNERQSPCFSTVIMSNTTRELLTEIESTHAHLEADERWSSKVNDSYRYTSLVARGPDLPIPNARVFFFDLPAVCLISQECGSAADVLAWLFENNKRVAMIGSETHGSGFGFYRGESISKDLTFHDSFNTLKLDIPNQAWGRPSKTSQRQWERYENYWERFIENVPVRADISYMETSISHVHELDGWLNKAAEVLASEHFESRPQSAGA
jgi:hypothetical protein